VGGLFCSLTRLQFLQAQGHPVSILDFLPSSVDQDGYDQVLAERGGGEVLRDGSTCRTVFRGVNYSYEVLPVDWDELMSRHQPTVGVVQRALQREGVDYVFTSDEGYWPLQAAWRSKVRGAHVFNTLDDVRRFARNPGYVWLLRQRTVVAASRFMQAQIKARLGLDAAVWHPSVDADAYRCRRVGERTQRIGFYSARGKIKGSEIVAQIVARMPEREFVVVGRYDEVASGAIPENLTYWGYIPDMRRFYRQIDLLLVPSVWPDPHPRVIVEAAVNGIPSIANRVGGIAEALGDSGVLVDAQPDAAAAAELYVAAIRRLMENDALYLEYSRKALARADAYEQEQIRSSHEFRQRYICA
jgi:glycosyltransferase involved in cell wall biosynthesis